METKKITEKTNAGKINKQEKIKQLNQLILRHPEKKELLNSIISDYGEIKMNKNQSQLQASAEQEATKLFYFRRKKVD